MTCIVGLISNSKVLMGFDRAVTMGGEERTSAMPKAARKGQFIIGCSGSVRAANLALFEFDPPRLYEGVDMGAYMAKDFVDSLRQVIGNAGARTKKDEVESFGCWLLVGVKERLFIVASDFSVVEVQEPYQSIGSGSSYALGALYANAHLEPDKRILQALEAAEKFSTGVAGPFEIITT